MNTSFMESVLLLGETDPNSITYRRICDSLETTIMATVLPYPEIQGVGVIGSNHVTYYYSQKRIKNYASSMYFSQHYLDLEAALKDDSKIRSGVIPSSDPNFDPENPSFFMGGGCLNYEKMRLEGTLILFINPSVLNSIINEESSTVSEYTTSLLTDSNGWIVCDTNANHGKQMSEIAFYQKLGIPTGEFRERSHLEKRYIISDTDLSYLDFDIIRITDYDKMNASLRRTWMLTLLSTLFVLGLLLFWLYALIGKNVIKPIERIAHAMSKVDKENLDHPIPAITKGEIGDIERSYNDMLQRIKTLIAENEEQTSNILEINRRAVEAELRSLELQINPHFIFNTLNAINWMALEAGIPDVSESINQLASIFRYTVYNINSIVPIEQDIEWTHQYLKLQETRFRNKFSYSIFCAPEVNSLNIHKLLLQPLLENALIHGFDGIDKHGEITVSYQILCKRVLRIMVINNGVEIEPETLKHLQELTKTTAGRNFDTSRCIGVANVVYRMKEYYPNSRILIVSANKITGFKLFIPLNEMKELPDDQAADC